jgi:hypothetical protein
MIRDLTNGNTNFVLTSDRGGEFTNLKEILPEQAAHRFKQSTNDISIVDRQMQTIKRDLAAQSARRGGDWDENLPATVQAYNERDHDAVFGPPADVELNKEQEFYVLADNAEKFAKNSKLTQSMMKRIRDTETIRPPVDRGGRSFRPSFGDAVAVTDVGSHYTTTADGGRYLTKSVQAVPRGSAKAVSALTDPSLAARGQRPGSSTDPAPGPPPRPETQEERNARIDRRLAESRAIEERAQAAREAKKKARLEELRMGFGTRPR